MRSAPPEGAEPDVAGAARAGRGDVEVLERRAIGQRENLPDDAEPTAGTVNRALPGVRWLRTLPFAG